MNDQAISSVYYPQYMGGAGRFPTRHYLYLSYTQLSFKLHHILFYLLHKLQWSRTFPFKNILLSYTHVRPTRNTTSSKAKCSSTPCYQWQITAPSLLLALHLRSTACFLLFLRSRDCILSIGLHTKCILLLFTTLHACMHGTQLICYII